jgi:hypothetical protein
LLPTECALDHPAVAARLRAALDSAACEARGDTSLPQPVAQGPVIIRLVGVQLLGAWPRAATLATHRGDRVHHLKHPFPVRHVRTRERGGERDATAVYHLMAFRARFAPIRRVRPDRAPFFRGEPLALTLTESTLARLQSISPVCSNRINSSWCNLCHTPTRCQLRSRHQQVIPLPQPISCGSISHGMPLLKTKRMPVSAARSDWRVAHACRYASAEAAGAAL